MKRTIIALACSAAIGLSTPLAASEQRSAPTSEEMSREMAAMSELFGDMFGEAEPLTPDQEARLPAAQSVVLKLFPMGTYSRMMDETMRPMMNSMMANIGGSPAVLLLELTGLAPSQLQGVENQQLAEALALLDPNAAARNAEISDMMLTQITRLVVEMEPAYRSGLARAYAVRFTEAELADLDSYFSTETGGKYAAESLLIFADPQVMAQMNQMMPAMMQSMPAIMEKIGEVAGKYPQGRTFSELTPEEQDKLAALLGASLEDLAASEPDETEVQTIGNAS